MPSTFTVLVMGLWFTLGNRSAGSSRPTGVWREGSWLMIVPLLGMLLGINVGYHYLLSEYLQIPPWMEPQVAWDLSVWTLLLICVQPAVVEEIFFRRLLFDVLQPHSSVHGTVWITSVIFGLAHIGAPFSIPVLILVGAGLGYVRWLGGSIWPCIVLHFLHNSAVVVLENAL